MDRSSTDLRPYVRRPQSVRALRATEAHADGWAARRRDRTGRLTAVVDAESRSGLVRMAARQRQPERLVLSPYVWSRQRRVYFLPGDWIVLFDNGEVYVYDDERFRQHFEEASDG